MELQISHHLEALNFVYYLFIYLFFWRRGGGGGGLEAGHSLSSCFQEGNFENILG